MATRPALINLPVELIVEVAKELDDKNYLTPRSVSPKLAAASSDVSVERFFREVKILYSSSGLQAFIDITSRPYLVRKLKVIRFTTFERSGTHDRGVLLQKGVDDKGELSEPFSAWDLKLGELKQDRLGIRLLS